MTKKFQNKKIIFICSSLLEPGTKRGGGIEEIDFQIALHLKKKNHLKIIGPFYEKYNKSKIIDENFIIEYVHFPAIKKYPPKSDSEKTISFIFDIFYSVLLGLKLIFIFKQKTTDIVVVHNSFSGFVTTLLCKLFRIKILFSEGNLTPWFNPYIHKKEIHIFRRLNHLIFLWFGTFIAKKSDLIRVQSVSIQNGMEDCGITQKKIFIIPAGVDIHCFFPRQDKDFSYNNIGFIGRLTEEKGVLELIRVIKKIDSTFKFFIFGDGKYKANIASFSNIQHIGVVKRDELNFWLSRINIILFFQKDLGLAEIESMAAGKVILAYNIGEIPKVIHHLKNGLLCEPTADSYISNIMEIIGNKNLMREISYNARITAQHFYSWEKISDKWELLFLKILRFEE